MCQVAFGRFTLKFSLKHECCYMQAQKRVEKLCFCSNIGINSEDNDHRAGSTG